MKLLLDTNIFLEVFLEQERADEARQLLLKRGAQNTSSSSLTSLSIP